MKIAVYAICKNEEKHVERFMDSIKDADFITVADTGSTDYTVENLKTKAIRNYKTNQFAIHSISINPWRFDTARNVALALVPADVDVCIRLDLDEVLDPGWRAAIEAAWKMGTTNQLWYWFEHSPGYRFQANYIHSRHGYVWRGMDHEGLYPATGFQSLPRFCPNLSITHHQDRAKARTAILPRLEAQVLEDRRARTLYYLGREYFYYGRSDQCIAALQEYLKQPDATWDAERMDVLCMMAKSEARLCHFDQAINLYFRALGEYRTREPLLGLAELLIELNRHDEAFHLAKVALTMQNQLSTIHVNPAAWNGRLEEIVSREECTIR